MDPLYSDHRRLAVLIDADNASANSIAEVMHEITLYGAATIRRAYGDWTSTRLAAWKKVVLQYAIQPVQQFSYTSGKNATDGAMIIDAMDLLYARKVAGFCIVSSDSDFTRLCTRLRESDMVVLGFGNRTTPPAFVASCHRFTYPAPPVTDAVTNVTTPAPNAPPRRSTKQLQSDQALVQAMIKAASTFADAQGWTSLATLNAQLKIELPGFAPKNYGYAKFLKLLEATELFVVEQRAPTAQFARLRRRLDLKAAKGNASATDAGAYKLEP